MKKLLAFPLTLLLFVTAPAWAISTANEIEIGRQAAARFEAEYGLVSDAAMQGRLQRIGQRLLAGAERKDLPWSFRVVAIDEFNAAAFPGGFIYATRGLMRGLNDEELAFVIAHEIAHVDKRHSIRQIEQSQATQLGLLAILIGANRSLDIPQAQATLASLANAVIQSGHSREHEAQADNYGSLLMSRTGYDPVYSVLALEELSKQSHGGAPGFLNTLLGSHPLPKDRVREASDRVFELPFDPVADPPVEVKPETPVQTRLLTGRSAELRRSLELAGLRSDPALQARSKQLALGNQRAGVVRTFPASASLATIESALLLNDLRPGNSFGLTLAQVPDGRQRVTMVLK